MSCGVLGGSDTNSYHQSIMQAPDDWLKPLGLSVERHLRKALTLLWIWIDVICMN